MLTFSASRFRVPINLAEVGRMAPGDSHAVQDMKWIWRLLLRLKDGLIE